MKEHAVTITLSVPENVDHSTVQARVLEAVGREFAAEREGALSVRGFDRAGLEAKLADMTRERNDLHAAWLSLKHGGGLP